MNENERARALRNIQALVPDVVFDRFIMILTQINTANNDALVFALNSTCCDKNHTFIYRMSTGQTEADITPIREILDLFEGWIITSKAVIGPSQIRWEVESIVGKEQTK